MQQGGWFRGLDLERPPAAFVRRPCRAVVQTAAADLPTTYSSSSIVQAAADLGSCHQPARQEDPAPHQKDLQHLLLSPRQLHHGLLGSRYRRSGESYHHHSIHHFWIQLKVTELNRVESSTLLEQLFRQIIFYWRIQYCFIEQNNFSTMFLRCSKSTFSINVAWWLQCSEEQLLFLANRKFACPVWTGRERWHGLLSGDLLWGQHHIQNLFGRLSNSALDLMI